MCVYVWYVLDCEMELVHKGRSARVVLCESRGADVVRTRVIVSACCANLVKLTWYAHV
jgi:hypothetical protein